MRMLRRQTMTRTTAGKVWMVMALWMAVIAGIALETGSDLAWVGSFILTVTFTRIGFNYLTHPVKSRP